MKETPRVKGRKKSTKKNLGRQKITKNKEKQAKRDFTLTALHTTHI